MELSELKNRICESFSGLQNDLQDIIKNRSGFVCFSL